MKKRRPLLILSISMVWLSVADELLKFTDGRNGPVGELAMNCVALGLVIWGVLDHFRPAFCVRASKYVPLLCAIMSLVLILPVKPESTLRFAEAAVFGTLLGMFVCSALADYVREVGPENVKLMWMGFSIGLYKAAVYPFGILYYGYRGAPAILSEPVPQALSIVVLAVVALWIFYRRKPAPRAAGPVAWPQERGLPLTASMIVLIVVLTLLHQILKSGILLGEYGGTENVPLFFLIDVATRIPIGMLLGWLADRGLWYYAVGFPLVLIVSGSALSLYLGTGGPGDMTMLSLFNLGGNGFLYFAFILAIHAARRNGGKALTAGLGFLLVILLIGVLNVETLHISTPFFESVLRGPLTLAVIPVSLVAFLLILMFLASGRKQEREVSIAKDALAFGGGGELSALEQRAADLMFDGYSQGEIAQKLRLPSADTMQLLRKVRLKLIGDRKTDPDVPVDEIADAYGLTMRERQMLLEIASGKTNPQIAAELFLSENTVKTHMRSLFAKLPVKNRAQLREWAKMWNGGKTG